MDAQERKTTLESWIPKLEELGKNGDDLIRGLIQFNWEKMQRADSITRINEIGNFIVNSAEAPRVAGNIVAAS
jgi:hypothetical protein